MTRTCFAFLVLASCVPPAAYVADVHYDGAGNLVAEKCQFDGRGRATTLCHTEAIDAPAWSPPPDPPTVAAAERAANAPAPSRPAPATVDVERAIASPGVHRAVELCRTTYEPALARFAFTLAVAPSGAIAVTPHGGSETFASCASRALQGANLLAYDGAPVSFEQTVAF